MNLNNQTTNSESLRAQARILMSRRSQKTKNRQESMLHRAAEEMGIDL